MLLVVGDNSITVIVNSQSQSYEQVEEARSCSVGHVPRVFLLDNDAGQQRRPLQRNVEPVDCSEQMQNDEFEGRDGEDVVQSVPLQLSEEDFALSHLAKMIHEGREDTHAEYVAFENGLFVFEDSKHCGKSGKVGHHHDQPHEGPLQTA